MISVIFIIENREYNDRGNKGTISMARQNRGGPLGARFGGHIDRFWLVVDEIRAEISFIVLYPLRATSLAGQSRSLSLSLSPSRAQNFASEQPLLDPSTLPPPDQSAPADAPSATIEGGNGPAGSESSLTLGEDCWAARFSRVFHVSAANYGVLNSLGLVCRPAREGARRDVFDRPA